MLGGDTTGGGVGNLITLGVLYGLVQKGGLFGLLYVRTMLTTSFFYFHVSFIFQDFSVFDHGSYSRDGKGLGLLFNTIFGNFFRTFLVLTRVLRVYVGIGALETGSMVMVLGRFVLSLNRRTFKSFYNRVLAGLLGGLVFRVYFYIYFLLFKGLLFGIDFGLVGDVGFEYVLDGFVIGLERLFYFSFIGFTFRCNVFTYGLFDMFLKRYGVCVGFLIGTITNGLVLRAKGREI